MRDDRSRSVDQDQSGARDWRGYEAPAGREDLGRRLDSLPDGHPSSPNESDGTPRSPTTRLRDLDPWPDTADTADTRPYTDAEWSEHIKDVPIRIADAHKAGLATYCQYTIDPDRTRWSRERRHLHEEIIAKLYDQASSIPTDRKAIIAGGLAGAGKTTVLGGFADINQAQYMTINPDNVKDEMARRGMVPEVSGLSPMEASDLIHEESSYVARQLASKAQAEGKNIIWDITMSDHGKTAKRIDDLRAAGYHEVDGIFVDIPAEVSVRRADARHREGEDDYRAGKGLGGRYIPREIISAQSDEQWGSQNRRTFEDVKPLFDQWTLFDNGVDGRDPIRVDASSRDTDPMEAPR